MGIANLTRSLASPIIDHHSSVFNPCSDGAAEVGAAAAAGAAAVSSACKTNRTCSISALSANFCTARRATFWLARSKVFAAKILQLFGSL